MAKINIRLWRNYKLGLLNRKLTHEEQINVDDCDFAMHLLLPTKSFVKLYNQLQNEGCWNENQIFDILCMTFRVPLEAVQVKLHEIKNVEKKKDFEDCSEIRRENIKISANLGFWKVYKMDKLNRDLLPLEEIRVNECDSAMEILVPNDIFIPIYNVLKSADIIDVRIVTMLAIRFKVPTDIIEVKIYEYEKGKKEPKLVK